MAKSNKPIFWSLFAAGATLAAFLAPVLVGLFLLTALGQTPSVLGYARLHGLTQNWMGKIFLMTVVTLFLWHAAHRLRITLHDLGIRQDPWIALCVYLFAAINTGFTALLLLH